MAPRPTQMEVSPVDPVKLQWGPEGTMGKDGAVGKEIDGLGDICCVALGKLLCLSVFFVAVFVFSRQCFSSFRACWNLLL